MDLVAQVGAGKHIRKIKMLDDLLPIQLVLISHVQLLNLLSNLLLTIRTLKQFLKALRDNPGATAIYTIYGFCSKPILPAANPFSKR
jgi:hypothetical protein